ncbi:GNAT family N-acetyltransferase [Propionivibrio sp.]|uniref:GNAT family N-acetyltransferase n=1 Tax=Propionivibrio sp. TaxID=2212460 RepID=UPI003BF2481F
MQNEIIVARLAEKSCSPGGQAKRPLDAECRLLPSLRPLWGLLPRRREYDIRPARTAHHHGLVNMLVQQMYSWRGYNTEAVGHRADDANRVTLAAWHFDEVVATLTLGRDSSAGLLADALYPHEIASLRGTDRVVCEVSRLAVDPDFSSRGLLTALFQATYKFGKNIFAASDAVIEVNPRHARYYQRLLGFQQLGKLRQCQRVDAPAVLLHQEIDSIVIPGDDSCWDACTNCGFHLAFPHCA